MKQWYGLYVLGDPETWLVGACALTRATTIWLLTRQRPYPQAEN